MFAVLYTQLMMSPDLWLLHFDEIFPLITSEDHVRKLIELFKQGLKRFFSIDMALRLSKLVNSNHCTDAPAQDIWNILLSAYGYNFANGTLFWIAYLADVMRRDTLDSPEKCEQIVEKFKQVLALPLRNIDTVFMALQRFYQTHGIMLPNFNMSAIEEDFAKTKQWLSVFENFEIQLEASKAEFHENELNKQISVDEKKTKRLNLLNDISNIYCDHIAKCTNLAADKKLPIEVKLSLHERMINDEVCRLNVSAWKIYIEFLFKLIGSAHNTSCNFGKNLSDVIGRGMQQPHPVQQAVHSAVLNALIHINENPDVMPQEFKTILHHASQFTANDCEDLVANIIVAYLREVKRLVSEKKIEDMFNKLWQFFITIYDECEKDVEKREKLWERAISQRISEKRKLSNLDEGTASSKCK